MAKIIKVCMGSSCFARGNAKNLQLIQSFIEQNNIEAEVELTGLRCCNQCSRGPIVSIDDEEFHNVDCGSLVDILQQKFEGK